MDEQSEVRTDVSERERTLTAIADNVDAVIFAMDSNAVFTLSRGRGLARLDLEPDQVVGADARAIYAGSPRILEGIDSALAGRPERVIEQVGDTIFDISFAPDIDESGRIRGLVGVGYDITDTVRAAQELSELNARLEEATLAKSRFLASMSHELRTPLNSIIGFSDLLGRGLAGELNEEQLTQVTMINQSGQHLLALIDDVLDLAKVEAGHAEAHSSAFDAVSVVTDVVESMRPLAAAKDLELGCHVPEGPVTVTSDHGKVVQILINLVGNALKFTDAGEVAVGLVRTDAGTVEFSVRDSGPGIPPEHAGRVFAPFIQLDREQTRARPQGTGLGLALSQEYAQLLGGEILLESEVGVGSTFTLRLPVAVNVAEGSRSSDA